MAVQRTIAVVDDDPGILEAVEPTLLAYGYHTELFASAEEFQNAAATLEAACLVVDIQIGDTSGMKLVRRLSAMGFAVPVIFITGSRDELHRQQALGLGCVAFLLKPVSADRLIEAITKAISSRLH